MDSLQERPKRGTLVEEIGEFCRETFPHSTELSTAIHILREAVELMISAAEREGIYISKADKEELTYHVEMMMDVTTMANYRSRGSAIVQPTTIELASECADIFHLLVQMAINAGFDLEFATKDKLEVNKTRKWKEPDEYGVIEHERGRNDDR